MGIRGYFMVIKATGLDFELFCKNYAVKKDAIYNDCLSKAGKVSSEDIRAEYKKRSEELSQETYDVLPDEWRVLANKQDKTLKILDVKG